MNPDHDRRPPTAAPTGAASPQLPPPPDHARPAESTPARDTGEWVVALDPATRRFRVHFPDSGAPRHSEEHWLMIAFALGIEDAEFRERVINAAFEIVIDRAESH